MKVVVNNLEKNNTKEIMQHLLNCVKDKSLSISERNVYYSEYLQLAKNFLILSK